MKEALDGAIAPTRSRPAREPEHRHPPRDREHREGDPAQVPNCGHPKFTGQAAEQW